MKTNKNYKTRIVIYAVLSFAILTAVLVSDIAAAPEIHAALEKRFLPPSMQHFFGTDDFGRDVFLRTLQGFKYTFLIALTAQIFSFLLGGIIGLFAGYYGGMQHRVLTALGLSCKPSLLILDEPTRGMDMILRNEYASLIKSIYDTEHIAILFITHDLELAHKLSHRCALMHKGKIVEEGETRTVFKNGRSAYFRSLKAAMPQNIGQRR